MCQFLRIHLTIMKLELAINSLEKEVRGLGGVVVLDRFGVGFAFNTPRMAYAFLTDDNPNIHFGINP